LAQDWGSVGHSPAACVNLTFPVAVAGGSHAVPVRSVALSVGQICCRGDVHGSPGAQAVHACAARGARGIWSFGTFRGLEDHLQSLWADLQNPLTDLPALKHLSCRLVKMIVFTYAFDF